MRPQIEKSAECNGRSKWRWRDIKEGEEDDKSGQKPQRERERERWETGAPKSETEMKQNERRPAGERTEGRQEDVTERGRKGHPQRDAPFAFIPTIHQLQTAGGFRRDVLVVADGRTTLLKAKTSSHQRRSVEQLIQRSVFRSWRTLRGRSQ